MINSHNTRNVQPQANKKILKKIQYDISWKLITMSLAW